MSVITTGKIKLNAYSNKISQRHYVSTYYTLANDNFFIEYKNPINLNNDNNFFISHYITNFGDSGVLTISDPADIVTHSYMVPGNYYISYSAVYVNGYGTFDQQIKYSNSLNNFNKIILNVSDVPRTTPQGDFSNPSYEHASYNILKYKSQLQLQLVEYAKYNYPSAMNNDNALSAKCYRDMGYVIDALAADILNNANHRCVDLGNMYFQTSLISVPFTSTVPTLPQTEVAATIACIGALADYINGTSIPAFPIPFTTVGILSASELGSARKADVINRINDIIYPLSNSGLLKAYSPAGNVTATDLSVADIILNNKSRIQKEVAAYVLKNSYVGLPDLVAKCNRDVGLILDAIVYEIKTGVMSKSIQYALAYWEGSTSRLKNSTVSQHQKKTVDSITQINNAITNILLESSTSSVIKSYNTNVPINVKSNWEYYNQNLVRLNDEVNLTLPYSLEQINIQPNEWGVEDIFNTSISRLQECLEYLVNKSQTINTYAPTLFFGWLGNNTGTAASKLKWFTQSHNSEFLYDWENSRSSGISHLSNVVDIFENQNFLYIIDDDKLKIFYNLAEPEEIVFLNNQQISELFYTPVSLTVNDDGDVVYVCDKTANMVYKLKASQNFEKKYNLNLQLFVGGFGSMETNDNFNAPTEIIYKNSNLYVLDYNNFCIKQYNQDLVWLYTYYISDFAEDRPIGFDVLENGLIYVLSENYKVYIFDNFSNILFETLSVDETKDDYELNKIRFSKNGDFVYILTDYNVYKYTLAGSYVTTFNIPKHENVKYSNIKTSKNNTVILASQNCVLKYQDVLQVFRVGGGLPQNYWTNSQLTVDKNEFSSDIVYNRTFKRIVQNIKTFRDTLNAKFVMASENMRNNVVTYFSYLPIDILTDSPKFLPEVESEEICVGVNELHIPSVFNKEFKKIYNSLEILSNFLNIENYFIKNSDCVENFCWSWDATSCYNLKLPVIKTCDVNPISFVELSVNEVGKLNYAPNVTWEDAKSDCCKKTQT